MTAITAQGVFKHFGRQEVLANLELTVPAGAIYGLLGRNGAGKTTLLKLTMGPDPSRRRRRFANRR